jgi:membrane dipeptidase
MQSKRNSLRYWPAAALLSCAQQAGPPPPVESARNPPADSAPTSVASMRPVLDAASDSEPDSPPTSPAFFPATDLHVDLGWQLHTKMAPLSDPMRQANLKALMQGHVGTLVVSLYIDKAYQRPAAEVRAEYEATFADVQQVFQREGQGLLGAPFAPKEPGKIRVRISFEGADGFATAQDSALTWLGRGACVWGLVHKQNNALGGSSQDPSGSNLGLKAAGSTLATKLVAGGGVLDVSHASDQTVSELIQIAEAASAPVMATHTGMRALHNIKRNISDDQIKRIAKTGGVVGVSFYLGHLTSAKQATLDDVVRHIEHLRSVGGINVLALGSDFEGGIVPPVDAPNIGSLAELTKKLRAKGFTDAELEAFFYGNAERVFNWAETHGCGKR